MESLTPRRRIVITAFGSLGDLHPMIAVALGMRHRGHAVTFATGAHYRAKIEALGLDFRPIRPDSVDVTNPAVMPHFMDFRRGTIRIVTERILPALRESFHDIAELAAGADLLLAHPLMSYATRLVSEATGTPWASAMITPLGFFSAHDLPVITPAAWATKHLRRLGPGMWGPLLRLCKWTSRGLAAPWYRFRAELGLPPTAEDNPLSDCHSPRLVLAMFSGHFAPPQPDWPPQTIVTGFPFYDGESVMPPELVRFLDDGEPPIVFTLGITGAMVAGRFFESARAAATALGRRAVLVVGPQADTDLGPPAAGIIALPYAPFLQLFDRAEAIVHHGGIGTTGLALRAGRPSLVVPFAHDNPDNAARLRRLGVGLELARHRVSAARLAEGLATLRDDPRFDEQARRLGSRIRTEAGIDRACEALEASMAERAGSTRRFPSDTLAIAPPPEL